MEIIEATKGHAQLYKSAGWKRLVEEYREQLLEIEEPAEPDEILDFGIRYKGNGNMLRFDAGRTKTLALRRVAELHDDIDEARAAAEETFINRQLDREIFVEMSIENQTDNDLIVIDVGDRPQTECPHEKQVVQPSDDVMPRGGADHSCGILNLLSTNGIRATGFQPVSFSVMYYNLPSHF
jgi:hypothetical protein